MDSTLRSGLAYRHPINQGLGETKPTRALAQVGQWRTGQGVAGATARRTAIARKAMGRSPSNQMGSITVGTTRGRMGFQKPICR